MCKLVFVDNVDVVDVDTLESCSGICFEGLFKRVERKMNNFLEDGYEFKVTYSMNRKTLAGTDYDYKSVLQDFGSEVDAFFPNNNRRAIINKFKSRFLDDVESLFERYKGCGRDMTRLLITFESSIGSYAQFEYHFDPVLSYAYYMLFSCEEKRYKKYMKVVHETWEGIRNYNDTNYLPELWIPKTPTGVRPKRIGDMP